MKIAIAQINCHIGNFESNTDKIVALINKAQQGGAEIIIFPELAVCGYPPLDFLDVAHFTKNCITSIETIALHCVGITAIVGSPSFNPILKGKNLFNSAFVLADGSIQQLVNKTLLPTYDVFDEYRYFEPNSTFKIVTVAGKKIALTICEDLWNEEDDPLYVFSPMEELIKQGPELIINIAASPFDYHQQEKRKSILRRNVLKYKLPLFYVNHAGAQTDILFDGGSLALNHNGSLVAELGYFIEDFKIIDLESESFNTPCKQIESGKIERIHDALVMGIRDYFVKMNFTKATLGLSGGIDSALVFALAVEALGKENVLPVMMPSPFSSDHSISDSVKIANTLGVDVLKIPIETIYDTFLSATKSSFDNLPFNVAEENIQARIRGTLLMAISNKHGYILLNTSNKSELAVGYGTLYGDMAGGLSVIGDLYKTEVYSLCRYINRNGEIIPENILTKPPSAELRPGQKDSDSLPDYEVLDKVLFQYIECRQGPDEIINTGFDPKLVQRILKMVNSSEYKRFQFAPILRVSPKAFGRGRRMPLVARYLS
ncbi:MAG: NAD+ synthase [Bacteroidetes bacterium]|nr:NAD+ synthase [Bacteroidota bacterium]